MKNNEWWEICLKMLSAQQEKGGAIFATKSITILLQKHRLYKYQISLDLFTAPPKKFLGINMCTYTFLKGWRFVYYNLWYYYTFN